MTIPNSLKKKWMYILLKVQIEVPGEWKNSKNAQKYLEKLGCKKFILITVEDYDGTTVTTKDSQTLYNGKHL
jgi:hypothetical protein